MGSVDGSKTVDFGGEALDIAVDFPVDPQVQTVDGVSRGEQHVAVGTDRRVVKSGLLGAADHHEFRKENAEEFHVVQAFHLNGAVVVGLLAVAPGEEPEEAVDGGGTGYLLVADGNIGADDQRDVYLDTRVVFVNTRGRACGHKR